MPFVRKTDSHGSQSPTDTRKLFIGRTGELLFFVQNILKPEEPTHNIISIWGQGGEANQPCWHDLSMKPTQPNLKTIA